MGATKHYLQSNSRLTGRSTRLVDDAIQILFTFGEVIIVDHHGTRESNERLFMRVERRLQAEHPGKEFEILNKQSLTIKLKTLLITKTN